MPYRHDVFLSYRRDSFRDAWLIMHFIPVFKFTDREAIAAETGRLPQSIFFDRTDVSAAGRAVAGEEGIEPGQTWRTALERAIRYSRCVVAMKIKDWTAARARALAGEMRVRA